MALSEHTHFNILTHFLWEGPTEPRHPILCTAAVAWTTSITIPQWVFKGYSPVVLPVANNLECPSCYAFLNCLYSTFTGVDRVMSILLLFYCTQHSVCHKHDSMYARTIQSHVLVINYPITVQFVQYHPLTVHNVYTPTTHYVAI